MSETIISVSTGNVFQTIRESNGKVTMACIGFIRDNDYGDYTESDRIGMTVSREWLDTCAPCFVHVVRLIGGAFMKADDYYAMKYDRS